MMMAKQDSLDSETRDLVRFAAAIAQGYEPELRERVTALRSSQVPVPWVEELLLQSVLMVGYPRALIAFTVWRKFSAVAAPDTDPDQDYARAPEWARRGALNAGATFGQIDGALSIVNPLLSFDQWKKVKELWRSVRDGWSPAH